MQALCKMGYLISDRVYRRNPPKEVSSESLEEEEVKKKI